MIKWIIDHAYDLTKSLKTTWYGRLLWPLLACVGGTILISVIGPIVMLTFLTWCLFGPAIMYVATGKLIDPELGNWMKEST